MVKVSLHTAKEVMHDRDSRSLCGIAIIITHAMTDPGFGKGGFMHIVTTTHPLLMHMRIDAMKWLL